MKSVVIITPTIGSPHLKQCFESVQQQTYKNIKHLIVVDGEQHCYDAEDVLWSDTKLEIIDYSKMTFQILQDNVGANGWYGHRIYAAFSYLVNEDYIIYLDEDNWLEPNHVEALISRIENANALWSYAFRNIVSKEGEFICRDNCESLGWIPSIGNYNHVDTSCFCIRKDIAVKVSHHWYAQWGADRQFFQALSGITTNFAPSKEYSVNYRLDGNLGSPTKEFFLQGNKEMKKVFANLGKFPWEKEDGQNNNN